MTVGKTHLVLFVSILSCLSMLRVEGTLDELYINADHRVVSEGTKTRLTCFTNAISDQNFFTAGGKLEWSRVKQGTTIVEVVAEWTRSGGARISLNNQADATRFSISGGVGSNGEVNQQLIINSTSRTDQGKYRCALYTVNGLRRGQSSQLQITVRYPPAEYYPLCTATPNSAEDGITLLCQSEITTPPTRVQWYKDNNRVTDGETVGMYTKSTYMATRGELDKQFECRLWYSDDSGLEIQRSCRFSRPYVAILRIAGEPNTGEIKYHAFAHSSPPIVSDIDCSFLTPTTISHEFQREFPGYGVMTVRPVSLSDNGTDLVCRAKNAFGLGKISMPMYSQVSGLHGETTLPSMVTNYMSDPGTLNAFIVPNNPSVMRGANAVFMCSYALTTAYSATPVGVRIYWKFNGIAIQTTSRSRFTVQENSLLVSEITEDDDGATVTCVAEVVVEEMAVINISGSEATATIHLALDARPECKQDGSAAQSAQSNNNIIFLDPPFVIFVSILAALGWLILIVIIIFVLTSRNRKRLRPALDNVSSQMTFRASNIGLSNSHSRSVDLTSNPAQRLLPAQPSENSTSTNNPSKISVGMSVAPPCEIYRSEMAYQEMVGNTGVTKSRNGSTINSNGIVSAPSDDNASNKSLRTPPVMVPGPQGGFIPQNMAPESAVSERKSSRQDGVEMNYEDLDCIKQQRAPLATGNDYQTSISNRPRVLEQDEVLSHYANS